MDFLDGQKLVKVVVSKRARTEFTFDLGGILETRPYDRTSPQWMLFEPGGKVLTLLASGRYRYQRGLRA